jgi:ribonuclease P protein component
MKDIAIKENHLYQKAYRNGEKAHTKHLSIYILRDWGAKKQMLQNPEKKYINRIGLSVSKKIGGAVVRNRVKRIIRAGLSEARAYAPLKTGYLIVISARVGAHEASSKDMANELIRAFQKLDMYKHAPQNIQEAENK